MSLNDDIGMEVLIDQAEEDKYALKMLKKTDKKTYLLIKKYAK